MPPASTKLVFVAFLVVQAILWSQSRYSPTFTLQNSQSVAGINIWKRSESPIDSNHHFSGDECAPLSVPIDQQCRHVNESCDRTSTVLSIPYLHHYFCSTPSARPVIFGGLLVWLLFLFSTLGISASDFFCPNLATLAELLGLDENVAGVTFLAFGNGSPDVFSTFSAMRANSGSLAIGELLGAATFIVSVVIGSMCIIKPFDVDRKPFLRDVGFFTIAVAVLLVILWDGVLHLWEAATLIGLYILYVLVVVVGSWWDRRAFRRKQQEAIERAEFAEESAPIPSTFTVPYRDEPSISPERQTTLHVPLASPRLRAQSSPAVPPSHHIRLSTSNSGGPFDRRAHSRSRSPSPSPRMSQMPSFSLVGALEFRQVVASLQKESSGATLSAFESPVSPYAAGHYHSHSGSRLSRRNSARSSYSAADMDPWDAALASSAVPLNQRHSLALPEGDSLRVPEATQSMPVISTTPASPSDIDSENETIQYKVPSKNQRLYRAFWHTTHVLFPTLHNLRNKSLLGIIASILAAPAVLALTITLPVTVLPRNGKGALEKGSAAEGRLVDFEEEGVERILTAEDEVREEMTELTYNKWLMAAQCALGPLFCVAVLFAGTKHEVWLLIATAVASAAAALLVLIFSENGSDPALQVFRCFMGFFVAVVWIMAIADEVVNVLKTFGFIFGLSDGIIGLTIFAVGNSLADFVANISVAAFAPIMGFSACFGGPMLNMLLGVGISGTYILHTTGTPYYSLHFSTTLFVSTIGLLTLLCMTLIFIPLNRFHLPKAWGVFLIVCYVIIMTINIVVELRR